MTFRCAIFAALCGMTPSAGTTGTLEFPPGATMSVGQSESPASAMIPVGPYITGSVKMQTVEGNLRTEVWKISQPGLSTLQILEPLRQQLVDDGYQIVLDCKDSDCGGFDFRYELQIMPEPEMHVDLGDYRCLTVRKLGEGKDPEYISLMVSRSANSGFVQMTQVGGEPHDAGTIVASSKSTEPADTPTQALAPAFASDLTGLLKTVGRATLEDLTFDIGSARLGSDSFPSLDDLADYLKSHPDMTVALVGHTDSQGSRRANLELSRQRAISVMNRLIRDYAIPKRQLEADGVGYLSPRASNLTEDGRTQNRRVEVILTSTR